MSDLVDLTPGDGAGGLDGGDGLDGGESLGDVLMTPQGTVESIDDGFGDTGGGDDGGAGEGEWYDGLPDDLREKIIAKGYRSPEELARGWSEAESLAGRLSGDIGSLRDEVANLASQRGPNGDGYRTEPDNRPPTMQEVAAFGEHIANEIDEGRIDIGKGISQLMAAVAGVSAQREEYLIGVMEERMGERTAPLEEATHRTAVAREIQSIKTEVGDEAYAELSPVVKDLLQTWERTQPGFIKNPRSIRAAFGEALLISNARQRRGPSPAQQIIDEMDALGGGSLSGGLL